MDYDYFPAALLMEVIIHHVEVHYTIPMEARHMKSSRLLVIHQLSNSHAKIKGEWVGLLHINHIFLFMIWFYSSLYGIP